MKLDTVIIKRFRSINEVHLSDCGNFNVFIGKNNSGKSSILAAIHAFFTCIRGGNVANLNPPMGQPIDFFERDTSNSIEVTLIFQLTLAERDQLVRDIVTEVPQVRNAVDGIAPSLRLSTTVCIISDPASYSYVSNISIIEPGEPFNKNTRERSIFSIGIETANELQSQLLSLRKQSEDADALMSLTRFINAEDWRRLLTRPTGERTTSLPSSFLREINRDYRGKVDSMFRDASSYDEFVREIRTLATKLQDESKAVLEEPLKNKVGTFAGEEDSIPDYTRNVLRTLADMKVLHLTERRKDIGKEEAERILSLKMVRGQEIILRNLKETVLALLGVQIDAFQGQLLSATGQRTAELDVDNFLVEVNGSGIREALRLILDYEFEQPSILLVEEPETHLHPALETSMMRYLKKISTDCQVFITTHSTNFLDTAEMRNVYLISKGNSTHVQLLNLADAEAQIPRELGIRLSSLFMFDRLIFVEGPSDEEIIREWATLLNVNLGQANVGFISMGGVRNFAHFAAEKTLSFLTKRRVQVWFIIDKDERNDSDIARMEQMLNGKATIKALSRREIENYLLSARAIREYIGRKRLLAGITNDTLPSHDDIKQSIDDCAEELKQFALDKRVSKLVCKPVFPSLRQVFDGKSSETSAERLAGELARMKSEIEGMQSQIEDSYRQQSEQLEAVWQKDKLSIVPGDILLDKVCQRYNVRFIKDRDGSRLAALMEATELDIEIKTIISEIGRA